MVGEGLRFGVADGSGVSDGTGVSLGATVARATPGEVAPVAAIDEGEADGSGKGRSAGSCLLRLAQPAELSSKAPTHRISIERHM